ncbi:MAG: heavy metal sensor histidine kinase [Hydrogenophilaceae bacterium]|nr:heavy metal sensor histidine kinase [Hydrogenophilaceae bacterium]
MTVQKLGRSLTLRLALLYAASTLFILLSVGFYTIHVIDTHFARQDEEEMRGKLKLASRLIAKAREDDTFSQLPHQLDDALVGHHHLSLALFSGERKLYGYGEADYPASLLGNPAAIQDAAKVSSWTQGNRPFRGFALRLDTMHEARPLTLAVAVETSHHQDFIDNIQLTLLAIIALGTVVALALGWAVTRAGLTPLRQTAALARQIRVDHLDQRLPDDRVPPELEELTSSFNAMLDRLSGSFERLSAFAADLAHEMRTPVNTLMMQTQVMLTQARTAEEYREVLASNLEEYERLTRTIGDMLFLAKADNGLIVPSREPVDLTKEISELFDFYEALAEDRRIQLECAGAATVPGDPLMLRRALSNLLSNAIRHAPESSTVEVGLNTDHNEVCITFDNPCSNIDQNHLDHLFDRFYRIDPARRDTGEGAGLGLAITRSIAQAHGGEVKACLIRGGIRFELCLPKLA